jgi:hypothetical protein
VTIRLKCQCCGFEEVFDGAEAAFQKGWDAPPHFSGYVCCDLCPAVCIVLNAPHEKAHALWKRVGRPKQWELETCGTDEHVPGNPENLQ